MTVCLLSALHSEHLSFSSATYIIGTLLMKQLKRICFCTFCLWRDDSNVFFFILGLAVIFEPRDFEEQSLTLFQQFPLALLIHLVIYLWPSFDKKLRLLEINMKSSSHLLHVVSPCS